MAKQNCTNLVEFLSKIPSIKGSIGRGSEDTGSWWVKFCIDIKHPLAWQTVQELGHVLNYLSIKEKLPTSFYPVSPPPYLNGNPSEYLSWVIECYEPNFSPTKCTEWLENRLPNPVNELTQWESNE